MGAGLCLLQIVAPTPDGKRDQIISGQQLVKALLGIVLQFELGSKIVADPRSKTRVGFFETLPKLVLELFPPGRKFLVIAFSQGDETIVAAMEYAVERVIVCGRDWIILVVVTTSALDREPHRTARHHVDSVVDDVMGDANEAPSSGDESHCCQVRR